MPLELEVIPPEEVDAAVLPLVDVDVAPVVDAEVVDDPLVDDALAVDAFVDAPPAPPLPFVSSHPAIDAEARIPSVRRPLAPIARVDVLGFMRAPFSCCGRKAPRARRRTDLHRLRRESDDDSYPSAPRTFPRGLDDDGGYAPRVLTLSPRRWLEGDAAARFRAATPFAHLVVDDFVPERVHAELRAAFDDEDAERLQDEIFDVTASASPPVSGALAAFHAALEDRSVLDVVSEIAGEPLVSVETRAYVYASGQYLLPHADRDEGRRRALAYAFYVDAMKDDEGRDLEGGELDLYETEMRDGDIVRATVRTTIAPRANRCALFAVGPASLHRVREIRAGVRLSLAGWFHR